MKEISGLNWLRGIAALLVMLSHARPMYYENFNAIGQANSPFVKIFYLFTGLGSASVMVFFVLSGYLVAGSAQRAQRAGRWSWQNYLSRRLIRLWTVLLPCLVLTLILDLIGQYALHSGFYTGTMPEYFSGPAEGGQLSVVNFVGTLFFLQGILVQSFGSNGPLWSISYEFWYYVLFPLMMLACLPGTRFRAKVANIVVFLVISVFVGRDIMYLFPIWLMGYASWYLQDSRLCQWIMQHRVTALGLPLLVLLAMLVMRAIDMPQGVASFVATYILGSLVALSIPALRNSFWNRGKKAGRFLSDISYSLYLSHFPVLALLGALNANRRSADLLAGLPGFCLWILITMLVGWLVWFFFESRTESVRKWVMIRTGLVALID